MRHEKANDILLFYQNVRGIRTKTFQTLSFIESSGFDLIAFTETGCNESISDTEFVPVGYHIIRCDRTDGRKQGGALLVAAPRFELRRVPTPENIDINNCCFELVCAAVYLKNRFLFACSVVYIPPKTNENDYLLMFHILENLCCKYKSKIVILGDFNLNSCNVCVSNYYNYFLTFCELSQGNEVPNCGGGQLDLVLSGVNKVRSVCEAKEAVLPIDVYHPPLSVSVRMSAEAIPILEYDTATVSEPAANYIPTKQWNFYKANFPLLYEQIMLIDWAELYTIKEPSLALEYFYIEITKIIDSCVPIKKLKTVGSRYSYPEYYTADIISDIKLKYKLHKQYKRTKSETDYQAFSEIRLRVKTATRRAHDKHCQTVQKNLAKDPRAFWNYIRAKRGNLNNIKLMKDGRALANSECAKVFAEYFHSVYNPFPAELNVEEASGSAAASAGGAARAHIAALSRADVRRALAKLPAKRSAGPDGIPPYLLRDCRFLLESPLHYIFNLCLKCSMFPERWKLSRVVPVPKGKGGTEASDYRPVAVLCAPAKVLESAIQHSLYAQVSSQLSDAQHGFRPGRGTAGNLLHLLSCVIPSVDAGRQVDLAYFDFRKAFDTVDNDILLKKLARVGCTPHTLKFFADYLKDRRQYVDCGGCISEPYFTRSGVSQGSNLGPLQFIIMINDLPEVVSSAVCLLFADDLKLALEVASDSDHHRLQADIEAVVKWSRENQLYFNVSKCAVISLSRARAPRHHQYIVDGTPMQRVTEVKDLGLNITADLHFRKHIELVCKKAYRNLGFFLRQAREFTNIVAIRALYEALVRSHLESNAIVWAPHEAKYSFMLERIQNKFVRFVYLKLYGVYPFYPLMYPTLFVLGMVGYNKLEVRRELAIAIYVFKLLRGRVHNPGVLSQVGLCAVDGHARRRRRPRLLAVPAARTNLLQEAPLTRALRVLNDTADIVDIFTVSLNEFTKVTLAVLCN